MRARIGKRYAKRFDEILLHGLMVSFDDAIDQLANVWEELDEEGLTPAERSALEARILENRVYLAMGTRKFAKELWTYLGPYLEHDAISDANKIKLVKDLSVIAVRWFCKPDSGSSSAPRPE